MYLDADQVLLLLGLFVFAVFLVAVLFDSGYFDEHDST